MSLEFNIIVYFLIIFEAMRRFTREPHALRDQLVAHQKVLETLAGLISQRIAAQVYTVDVSVTAKLPIKFGNLSVDPLRETGII